MSESVHMHTHRETGKYSRMVLLLVSIDVIYKIHMKAGFGKTYLSVSSEVF